MAKKKTNVDENFWYDGKVGLRSVKTVVDDFTEDDILLLTEIYPNDYIKFIEDNLTIVDPEYGRTKARLRDYQKVCVQQAQLYNKCIWNLSRQVGKSTTVECVVIPYITFNLDKNVGIITHDLSKSKDILANIKKAYMRIDPKWQIPVVKWAEDSIELSNGCRVLVDVMTSDDPFRGYPIQFLYADEVAFVSEKDWERFVDSVLPALSSSKSSKIIYTSTPKGFNHFYNMVQEAESGVSDFKYLKYTWRAVPGRDDEWKDSIIRNTPSPHRKELFEQNYECEFIEIGGGFIDEMPTEYKVKLIQKKPLRIISLRDTKTKIYENPIENHKYVLGSDVSEGGGEGSDFSSFVILDITDEKNMYVVATFNNNQIDGIIFSAIINFFGSLYNNAFVLVENNAYGLSVCERLVYDFSYPNFINNVKKKLGINTNPKTKKEKIALFKLLVGHGVLTFNDNELIAQISKFKKKANGTYSASTGKDDLVLSLLNALWLFKCNQYDGTDILQQYKEKVDNTIFETFEQLKSESIMVIGSSKNNPIDNLMRGVSQTQTHNGYFFS